MKSWYELDISVEKALNMDLKDYLLSQPVRPGATQIWVPGVAGVWLLRQSESNLFTSKWLAEVKDRAGLTVTAALVFFRVAGYQHPNAHIDIEPKEDGDTKDLLPVSGSYNWVLEDTDAEMVWYEPWWDPDDYEQGLEAARNQAQFDAQKVGELEYNEIDIKKLTERERHRISHQQLTMVRTDIPHNVYMGSRDRWAVSARAFETTPDLWSDAYENIKHLVVS
ncbi:MAG TPA: hypothetical protein VLQ45_08575 [Thermoanaerobaculia bacterium]|nr:hypothetical protein [Thermoanaerobaculia bacterium]